MRLPLLRHHFALSAASSATPRQSLPGCPAATVLSSGSEQDCQPLGAAPQQSFGALEYKGLPTCSATFRCCRISFGARNTQSSARCSCHLGFSNPNRTWPCRHKLHACDSTHAYCSLIRSGVSCSCRKQHASTALQTPSKYHQQDLVTAALTLNCVPILASRRFSSSLPDPNPSSTADGTANVPAADAAAATATSSAHAAASTSAAPGDAAAAAADASASPANVNATSGRSAGNRSKVPPTPADASIASTNLPELLSELHLKDSGQLEVEDEVEDQVDEHLDEHMSALKVRELVTIRE